MGQITKDLLWKKPKALCILPRQSVVSNRCNFASSVPRDIYQGLETSGLLYLGHGAGVLLAFPRKRQERLVTSYNKSQPRCRQHGAREAQEEKTGSH